MSEDGVRGVLVRPTVRRRCVLLLWLVAAVAVTLRIRDMLIDPSLPGMPWQDPRGLLDFRDTLWVPGRFVLDGGNPYDPVAYLATHPWAQQFSPYPPVWLLLGMLLALLPFLVSSVVLQLVAVGAAVVMLRMLCRWAVPRWADLAVPIGLFWMNVWYPGRGAQSALGSVLAILGVVLVLRTLTRDRTPGAGRTGTPVDIACTVGIALTLIKPQFGVLVVAVALAAGLFRETWRAVTGFVLACVPALVLVVVAAGGPVAFVESLLRNLAYVHGPNTPGGPSSPFQRRFDLYGVLSSRVLDDPPVWLGIVLPLLAVVIAVLVVRRTREPFVLSMVVCTTILVGLFHPWYDLALILVPVAVGIGALTRGALPQRSDRIALAACVLAVLHLHTVSIRLVPSLTVSAADLLDFLLVVVAMVLAVAAGLGRTREPTRPAVRNG